MARKWFSVFVTLLLICLLVIGCGVPQEDYNAVVAERDAANIEVESLQSEIDKLEVELERTEDEVKAIESDLNNAEGQIKSLQSNLTEVKELLDLMEAIFGKI